MKIKLNETLFEREVKTSTPIAELLKLDEMYLEGFDICIPINTAKSADLVNELTNYPILDGDCDIMLPDYQKTKLSLWVNLINVSKFVVYAEIFPAIFSQDDRQQALEKANKIRYHDERSQYELMQSFFAQTDEYCKGNTSIFGDNYAFFDVELTEKESKLVYFHAANYLRDFTSNHISAGC